MSENPPADVEDLLNQLSANDRAAEAVVADLTEAQGVWRAAPGSWSVSECLDHLATGGRVYLHAMQQSADEGRARGAMRSRPARPGWAGRAFINMLEPPPKWWSRLPAPSTIRPRTAPPLASAVADFIASQTDVRAFVLANADLDLARLRFPNPFIPGIRFSLATGLHVIAAHNRRHLLQARRVCQAMEMDAYTASGTGG